MLTNEIQYCNLFFGKKGYELKEILLAFRTEYPKDGTSCPLVIMPGIEVSLIVSQKSDICYWCFTYTCVQYFFDDIHFKSYKFHLWHKLKDKDYTKG